MSNLNSARLREETPHISDALKRRAQSIINDKSIDAETRVDYPLRFGDKRPVAARTGALRRRRRKHHRELVRSIKRRKDRSIDESDLPSRRRAFSRAARPTLNTRKLHPPKSPREHSQAPCLHSLRRVEPLRHGRRSDVTIEDKLMGKNSIVF